MLLFGHRFIPSENFYHIDSVSAIEKTPPSSTLYLHFCEENLDIIEHINTNAIKFILHVQNTTELIYASALGAKFIFCLLYTSPSPRDISGSRMPSSA